MILDSGLLLRHPIGLQTDAHARAYTRTSYA